MTDWNQRYKTGDTPWDKGSAAPPLLEVLEQVDPAIWGNGEVLVPGCGTGHDVRALAQKGLQVLGLDLAPLAISAAKKITKSSSEKYELGNLLEEKWQIGRQFSAVWEHTCFCAIDPSQREDYAAAITRLLPVGGHLIGVFFLTPNEPHEALDGPPFNSSVEEIEALFSTSFEQVDSWAPKSTYPGREGKEWLAIYRKTKSS